MRDGGCCDHAERSVAGGDAEHVRAVFDGILHERCEVVTWAQDDHLDPAPACTVRNAEARGLSPTGRRIDE